MFNQSRKTLFGIITLLAFAGCNSNDDEANNNSLSLKTYQGTWSQQGTGLMLNVKGESVSAYRQTRETCLEFKSFSEIEEAEELITQIKPGSTSRSFSFVPQDMSEFYRITLVKM
jgi:hypothetical protein